MNKQLLMAVALAGLITAAHAGGDAIRGEAKSKPCQACHGPDGNSSAPNFPRLAGQYEDYLAQALKAYKSGARANPIMIGMVAPLSEQDMEDLAAYYATQHGLQAIKIGVGD
jgi:cytochrome c553